MRLAFSSTMSLTWMCSSGGSSKVLATTSQFGPATVRAMSVTSSGPFVDQQHDQVAFGMILEQAQGDLLQQDRLAGPRRRDDQAALALADRRHQIDDAHVELFGRRFQDEPAIRMQRRQVFEVGRRHASRPGRGR